MGAIGGSGDESECRYSVLVFSTLMICWQEEKVPELEFGCIYTGKITEILDRQAAIARNVIKSKSRVGRC